MVELNVGDGPNGLLEDQKVGKEVAGDKDEDEADRATDSVAQEGREEITEQQPDADSDCRKDKHHCDVDQDPQ